MGIVEGRPDVQMLLIRGGQGLLQAVEILHNTTAGNHLHNLEGVCEAVEDVVRHLHAVLDWLGHVGPLPARLPSPLTSVMTGSL